jgi:UDPglucose 6-dehydrogenase
MRVAVAGLWHLGLVTAACLAAAGHDVLALADDREEADALANGALPISEPGLDDLFASGLASGRLRVSADLAEVRTAEVVCVVYDTPVDDDDRADSTFVLDHIRRLFPVLGSGALVLISSQLPVGSTRRIMGDYALACPDGTASFAYSPENLRLGAAIAAFMHPDRVVAGTDDAGDRDRIAALLAPITGDIEWMGIESAEMTKHALNAWLGLSVAFANEIAAICERVGADAGEVARGVMTDIRVGPRAYLRPGAAFAGGTLARDLRFLAERAHAEGLAIAVAPAAIESNRAHQRWAHRRLQELLPSLEGRTIALLGLAYKPGTSTLRRSGAVDLARWLVGQRARVTAWDPMAEPLPEDLAAGVARFDTPEGALAGADAAVIGTPWPDLRDLDPASILAAMATPLILDPACFLGSTLGGDPRIRLVSVGRTA